MNLPTRFTIFDGTCPEHGTPEARTYQPELTLYGVKPTVTTFDGCRCVVAHTGEASGEHYHFTSYRAATRLARLQEAVL